MGRYETFSRWSLAGGSMHWGRLWEISAPPHFQVAFSALSFHSQKWFLSFLSRQPTTVPPSPLWIPSGVTEAHCLWLWYSTMATQGDRTQTQGKPVECKPSQWRQTPSPSHLSNPRFLWASDTLWKLGVATQTCNPSALEADLGGVCNCENSLGSIASFRSIRTTEWNLFQKKK